MQPCPACGGQFEARVPYPGRRAGTLRFDEIALCASCGLGMALPHHAQGDLDAFYRAGDYWENAVGRSELQRLHERNQCRHRVQRALLALGDRSVKRVLDIGAGHGWTAYWLERLAAKSFSRFEFIEPDEACSREILARASRQPAVRIATMADAVPSYDLVFLNHVLEHVADPRLCVDTVRGLLAPGGLAYFETPHADHRFKADVFPHTWFFTRRALESLAARSHVDEIECEVFGRMPGRGFWDLAWRGAFRASATLGLASVAAFCDNRVWRYDARREGIWIRWMIATKTPSGALASS